MESQTRCMTLLRGLKVVQKSANLKNGLNIFFKHFDHILTPHRHVHRRALFHSYLRVLPDNCADRVRFSLTTEKFFFSEYSK